MTKLVTVNRSRRERPQTDFVMARMAPNSKLIESLNRKQPELPQSIEQDRELDLNTYAIDASKGGTRNLAK